MQERANYCGTFHEGGSYSISLPIPQNSSIPRGALGKGAQSPPFLILIEAQAKAKPLHPWKRILGINGYAEKLNIVFEDRDQAPPPLLAMLGSLTDANQHTEWQPGACGSQQLSRGHAEPSADTAKEAGSPAAALPGLRETLPEHVGSSHEMLTAQVPPSSLPSRSNPAFASEHAKQQKDSDSANPKRTVSRDPVMSPRDIGSPGHVAPTLSVSKRCPKLGVPLILAFAAGVACCCIGFFLVASGEPQQPPSTRPAVADVACWQTPQSQGPRVATPFGSRPVGLYGTTPCSSRQLRLSLDQTTVGCSLKTSSLP